MGESVLARGLPAHWVQVSAVRGEPAYEALLRGSAITYMRTGVGWLYLATVVDLGSRRLLGYAMANHMRTELVAGALQMAALAPGGLTTGTIFHSDRGSQYMSGEFAEAVGRLKMRQSIGRIMLGQRRGRVVLQLPQT